MPMKIEVCRVCGGIDFTDTAFGGRSCDHCNAAGSNQESTVHTQAELDAAVKAAYETALSVVDVNWNKTNLRITEVRRFLKAKIRELENG